MKARSSKAWKVAGEAVAGFLTGFGAEAITKYIEGPNSILRTHLVQIGPNAWIGPDDIIVSAIVPGGLAVFKKYAGAAAALLGVWTVQGFQLLGGGISPITGAPLGLTSFTGGSALQAGAIYPRVSPGATVPGPSFYQQPRVPGPPDGGPKYFF